MPADEDIHVFDMFWTSESKNMLVECSFLESRCQENILRGCESFDAGKSADIKFPIFNFEFQEFARRIEGG